MKFEKNRKDYFIGLDIGTDSVGYAVTDENYNLCKFKGEPMWGVTLFEEAKTSAERRAFRTARRRLDRKQQRIKLLAELFAQPIHQIDPDFFVRLRGSWIYRTNSDESFHIFKTKDEDKEYYKKYPTIHHLIYDLMISDKPHDVRLIYIACAWLMAHRGHFLSEVNKDQIDSVVDFTKVYNTFIEYLENNGYIAPWNIENNLIELENVLKEKIGIADKVKKVNRIMFSDKKPLKSISSDFPFSCEGIVKLICGGKFPLKNLYGKEEYADLESISLDMEDEVLEQKYIELGDDAELLRHLKSIYDWSVLVDVLNGCTSISEAKINTYKQHNKDLKTLKYFIKKYKTAEYDRIFRSGKEKGNYVAYSYNVKSCPDASEVKKTNQENFCKYVLNKVKDINIEACDKPEYDEMLKRLALKVFMPKQKSTDNRVIPYQLYWYELNELLNKAEHYLPFLTEKDEDSISVKDKVLSVFEFRIPYYVGPLRTDNCKWAWMKRKSTGKIYPWNFEKLVDFDESERAFISRMTNTCTYIPGESVLPKNSLCYSSFEVLNEVNNLKINGIGISVELKQKIYNELFMQKQKITHKKICDYLYSNNYMTKDDELSGIDDTIKSGLKPYFLFKQLLDRKILSMPQVERIIEYSAYSEEQLRFRNWLKKEFPEIDDSDVKYIASLKLKNFGRLSKYFLCELKGADKETGEELTIMGALWNTNNNLMQLLSDRFTFMENVENLRNEYYSKNSADLSKRLDDMYISNSVKRPIIRTIDIVNDIVKVMGNAPKRIFIEMARDSSDKQKGKRTKSRKQQLIELYKKVDTDEVRQLEHQLEEMGDRADNLLQSDSLFLYYTQLGKCMYTGVPIDIAHIKEAYNIDHIYPQSFVKDDSVINNKVLVSSSANGEKSDIYPIKREIQNKMRSYWEFLKRNGLISDEKYMRLVRTTGFTDEEKYGFINRQLVETRQSTKALASLLKDKYSESEIVYVKAGLTSDFRNVFDIVKSRTVNDLHHAKDAYLNIVTGNVYYSRFNKRWFSLDKGYTIKTNILFTHEVRCGNKVVWTGEKSLVDVKKIVQRNNIHYTRYAFGRKGGLFDQMPVKSKEAKGLVPLKKGLPTEQYGGYNKPTASFFVIVKYFDGKKNDIMIMPVELLYSEKFLSDPVFAVQYAKEIISRITGKDIENIELLLDGRVIKINTMFSFDGLNMCITGKSGGGKQLSFTLMSPFIVDSEIEKYIKRLESFSNKQAVNADIIADEKYDHISTEKNIELYDLYINKFEQRPYKGRPSNPVSTLKNNRDRFVELSKSDQVKILLQIQGLFGRTIFANLTYIGGKEKTGVIVLSSSLSNWKYSVVRIVDTSASGLFEKKSINLMELL